MTKIIFAMLSQYVLLLAIFSKKKKIQEKLAFEFADEFRRGFLGQENFFGVFR